MQIEFFARRIQIVAYLRDVQLQQVTHGNKQRVQSGGEKQIERPSLVRVLFVADMEANRLASVAAFKSPSHAEKLLVSGNVG